MSQRRPPAGDGGPDRAALRQRLDAGLAAMDPSIDALLDAAARERMVAFLVLLARWNLAYNLTAVREPLEMVPRHLLDSLAVLPWITRSPVLDAGTGAGLPGIPLAIARPELSFTLLDSNGKKVRFVRQSVLELGLGNVEVVQERLETYRPRRKFATIVARAVASLAELREASAHLGAPEARLLAMKGRLPDLEIAGLLRSTAAGRAAAMAADIAVHPLRVPLLEGERNLIDMPIHATAHG